MIPDRAKKLSALQRRKSGPIEGTHLADAPNNPLAEWALDRIHQAAGLPS